MNPIVEKILACVDESTYTQAVAEHGAWLAKRLGLPLELLHVIERHPRMAAAQDHSGALGVDAQDHLLQELSEADAQRSRQAKESGRILLTGLREQLVQSGLSGVDIRQRHGDLEETLLELQDEVAHYVLGRRGAGASAEPVSESALWLLRSVRRPVWLVAERFAEPSRALIAYDGSTASRRTVMEWARSSMLQDVAVHVLMAASEPKAQAEVDQLVEALNGLGVTATGEAKSGEAQEVIPACVKSEDFDLLLMGAYSHSFWRNLVMGSKTQELLRSVNVTTLIQR